MLTNKERMKISRQAMPQQEGSTRVHNFTEVNLGFTEELAKMEALRCLQCPKPTCVEGCPVGIKIGDFISLGALTQRARNLASCAFCAISNASLFFPIIAKSHMGLL